MVGLLDLFREWLLEHPGGDGVDGLSFPAEVAVRVERLARAGLGWPSAADGDELVARRELCRRSVGRVLAAVFAVVHEEQRRAGLAIVEAAQRRRPAPRGRGAGQW